MILTSSGIRVHKSLFKFEGNLWFGTLRRRYVGEASLPIYSHGGLAQGQSGELGTFLIYNVNNGARMISLECETRHKATRCAGQRWCLGKV